MDTSRIITLEGRSLMLRLRQPETGEWRVDWLGSKAAAPMPGQTGYQRLPASPDEAVGPSLMPVQGSGFHGISQIDAIRTSDRRRVCARVTQVDARGDQVFVEAHDPETGFHCRQIYQFEGDVLCVETRLANEGEESLDVHRAASLLLPAPDWAEHCISLFGAWGREGHWARRMWSSGRIEQSGRGGRPGFDGGPLLMACAAAATEQYGQVIAWHLAWSGSFRLAAERSGTGEGQLLAEPALAPGEMRLAPGESRDLPDAVLTVSDSGFAGISHAFHDFARSRSRPVERKVHFNTWEARYFDVSEAVCLDLAKSAAELGAERFILDDGWFRGRRDDTRALGDWFVDPDQFPNGLDPLIAAVHKRGLSFGLWVEPEMVNPDSDLYRAHPDWVLGHRESPLPTGRQQYVLDLALPEVEAWLFERLSALLSAHEIDYLKWDCNRDLYPARREGVERGQAQTGALYRLLDRLNTAFPHVEIESCASGGGRIDMGILPRVTRFWTSDATDAIDRVRIQRAASLLMPGELLGAHVGPSTNPMTGRSLPMALRVLTAFFGHLGIEADPENLDETERAILRRGIAAYKANRYWMGTARLWRLSEAGEDPDAQILVSEDQHRAVLRLLRIDTPARPLQSRLRLAGLCKDARYSMTELALQGEPAEWPLGEFTGAGLMGAGEVLDPGRAQTGRLIFLERLDG